MAAEVKLIDQLTVGPTETVLYGGMGYVRLVDMMPRMTRPGYTPDNDIATAARTSYRGEAKTPEADHGLVRRLMKDRHTSPFEMVVFKFEISIPIFVERQLVRHRTASINEESHRYTPIRDAFYHPELRMQSRTNRQSSDPEVPVPPEAKALWAEMALDVRALHAKYARLLEMGVAREVARAAMPVSTMTRVVWQMNLHNLYHFLRLRRAPDAQLEIRQLADAIWEMVKVRVPVASAAFEKII